ncbi:MAG: ribosome-associated translation inhibitor RaiA [Acidobacteriota bacterium]|nr:ribosome-associated translation inhibitor RaiA [Acidobacteriota bacterium]
MNINLTARNTQITPEIEMYCARRLQSLEKILMYPVEAKIVLSVEKYRHKVEIRIKTKEATLTGVEETQDMLSSLCAAFDLIEKRIKKEKEKRRERKKRKRKEKGILVPVSGEIEQQKRIIHSDDYSVRPMSVEDAIIQFEASKKEVFVFRKIDSQVWAVLYRRKDGHYGLVVPE